MCGGRRRRRRLRSVVPANAGTHNHRTLRLDRMSLHMRKTYPLVVVDPGSAFAALTGPGRHQNRSKFTSIRGRKSANARVCASPLRCVRLWQIWPCRLTALGFKQALTLRVDRAPRARPRCAEVSSGDADRECGALPSRPIAFGVRARNC